MLKHTAFIFAVVLCSVTTSFFAPLTFEGINGKYFFYTDSSVSSDFICVSSDNALQIKKKIGYVLGEGIEFDYDKETVLKIIEKYQAKKVFSESAKNFSTDYYYSSKIPFYQFISGVKVNLQVAYSNGICKMGSPIIYGSF